MATTKVTQAHLAMLDSALKTADTAANLNVHGVQIDPTDPAFTPLVEGLVLTVEATLFAYHAYERWELPIEAALKNNPGLAGLVGQKPGKYSMAQLQAARDRLSKLLDQK